MLKRIRALFGSRAEADRGNRKPNAPAVHQGPRVVHHPIPEPDLDSDAVKIVQRLTRFDHTAYLVGGCVRDLLLDRKPKDFDIGTSATPRQIKRVFRNCRIIGRRFRLAHIYFQNGKIIEVATFRALDDANGESQGDGDLLIRDDNVFGTPEEDALRRDFTINQLFYDVNEERVIDHADGLGDLRRRLVRTIGDPEIRFREDPIRSLRAIKFAARLDFEIEKDTLAALCATRRELDKAAPPRILEEINRFCHGGAVRRSFELLHETGILEVILPEIAAGAARDPEAWSLLIDLLREMDERRFGDRREIRAGEIFAVLLLPLLLDRFGWRVGASPEPLRLAETRDVVGEALLPLARRLRIARREQEYCRQTLTTLFRMVPTARLRRGTRRAILNRPCLVDSLWMLDVVARRLGETYEEALGYWRSAREAEGDPSAGRREPSAEPGRSRRRRGGRGRSRRDREADAGTSAKPPPEARQTGKSGGQTGKASKSNKARKTERTDLPPVWDDRYFFAALPSAPDGSSTERKTDPASDEQPPERSEATARQQTAVNSAGSGDDDDTPRPARRRRRRRRRRPARSNEQKDGSPETAAEVIEPAKS